jgi:tetratricopeptide (TPR) repeat protein
LRAWIVLAALAFGFAASPVAADITSSAAEQQKVTRASAEAALIEAVGRARNNDPRGVLSTLSPVIGSPAFATLSEQQRYWGHVLFGGALYETNDYAGALREFRRATEFRQAAGNDWRMRFWAARGVDDHRDAAASLAMLAQRWPTALNSISSRAIWALEYDLRDLPERDALLFQILSAAHRANWRPENDPFLDNSYRWTTLTRLLLDRGETSEAGRIAASVRTPLALATMMIDRRFDSAMSDGPAPDALPALLDEELARVKALSAAHPDRLEGVNIVADALIQRDRGEEAVALLDEAIERAQSPRAGGRRFADQDENLNWTRNHRAWALLSVGRGAEAVEEMRRGARLPERGDVNVSQLINLAELLMRLGRNTEAIETLGDLDDDDVSGYGWMNARYVVACAKHEAGARAEADAALASMRARRDDSKTILRGTELCFDHFDEAARLFIEDLNDPDERQRALLDAQSYLEPRHETEFQTRMSARWRTLLARQDVRAAVERHGRVIALPIRTPNY